MTEHDYPEHEKLSKHPNQLSHINEFLEWLDNRENTHLTASVDNSKHSILWLGEPDTYERALKPIDLIAEFFGVDPVKLEEEKLATLEGIRELNAQALEDAAAAQEDRNDGRNEEPG